MKRIVAMLSLLTAGVVLGMPAQDVGTLQGRVTDAAGAPLPGVRVTAVEVAGGTRRETATDAQGAYSLSLPVGTYTVRVALAAFAAEERRDVRISSAATTRLDLTLRPAELEESVAATAAATPAPVQKQQARSMEIQSLGYVAGLAGRAAPMAAPAFSDFDTEAYARIDEIGFRDPAKQPLSTFSVDVDTASYANVRRFLADGRLPPKDAVRIEELVNYFGYDYPVPAKGQPFSVTSEVAACPWKPEHRLVLVGLRGRPLPEDDLPGKNLVFLLDVSGSMNDPSKLPLLKRSMSLLVRHLTARDRVAIVVYAGASGLVLPSTPGDRADEIEAALGRLEAGGSTHGSAGIQLAYSVAQESFVEGGVNRVILATDGDFNVGVTDMGALTRLIEEKREGGVFLSVLGFGTGNLKDSAMEALADRGNGNYAYIDSLHEARKVLVSQAGGTLVTIAKDVKIQVEFNPARVAAYRLVGYENRMLAAEDFDDDTKDAGEIGADHRVTALYEVVPAGVEVELSGVSDLKYQQKPTLTAAAGSGELLAVKLRYKAPDGDVSRLISRTLRDAGRAEPPSTNLGFAAAVAEFALLLRDSEFKGNASYAQVLELARKNRGQDPHNYRGEFIALVEMARELQAPQVAIEGR
jgi:Ca-activated chloride channel family protein